MSSLWQDRVPSSKPLQGPGDQPLPGLNAQPLAGLGTLYSGFPVSESLRQESCTEYMAPFSPAYPPVAWTEQPVHTQPAEGDKKLCVNG